MRSGKLAFVIYLLGVILTGGYILLSYTLAIRDPGMHNLGIVVLMVVSLIPLIAYGALLLLKVFYFITGWKLFPIISLIVLGYMIFSSGTAIYGLYQEGGEITLILISCALLILPPVTALTSEVKAFGD